MIKKLTYFFILCVTQQILKIKIISIVSANARKIT